MEYKSTGFEMTELSKEHRTGVIAHAVYDVIDRAGDISRKGMVTKSWNEKKAIGFYINHDPRQRPGKVVQTYEDEKKAYTKVSFGTHTLGNDTMLMMDEGIITDASFGFLTEKKSFLNVKGKKIRELKEVNHLETSVVYGIEPINPEAGVVMVTKAELKALSAREQELFKTIVTSDTVILQELVMLSGGIDISDDLYTWINYNISQRSQMIAQLRDQLRYNTEDIPVMKAYVEKMEKFIHDTKASDECIKSIEADLQEVKSIISRNDTANTRLISEPDASVKEFTDALYLLTLKI